MSLTRMKVKGIKKTTVLFFFLNECIVLILLGFEPYRSHIKICSDELRFNEPRWHRLYLNAESYNIKLE